MQPYWSDPDVTLYLGDCLKVLAEMEAGTADAVCTDPPYALSFMGREWDSFSKGAIRSRVDGRTNPFDGKSVTSTPEAYIAGQPFQAWCQQWAAECLRVLRPGGHLLAFGGTRTWHRLTCAIEDAGFEIRDCTADLTGIDGPGLLWVYGSGFPKSLDVSKAIDKAAGAERTIAGTDPTQGHYDGSPREPGRKLGRDTYASDAYSREMTRVKAITVPATENAARWDGWGTALKPAWEPIVVARKPLAGTVAQNVLKHGTGALNIDACRVACTDTKGSWAGYSKATGDAYAQDTYSKAWVAAEDSQPGSRWPPNLVLGPEAAAELDRQGGVLTSGANPSRRSSDKFRDAYGEFAGQEQCNPARGADQGGASRFFPVFRYEAKAGSAERPRGDDGTAHPTVKPVDLMAWLVRLVTPPGGTVLDPFAGSGTTAEACIVEGFRCVLIEKDPAYCELIRKRLRKDIQPVMFGEVAS
jgi:site-specific DNA-methyltransferase (adenine-specific)